VRRRLAVRFETKDESAPLQHLGVATVEQADTGRWALLLSTDGRVVYGRHFHAEANAAVRCQAQEERTAAAAARTNTTTALPWTAHNGAVFEFEWIPATVTDPKDVPVTGTGTGPRQTRTSTSAPAPRMRMWPRIAPDRVLDVEMCTRRRPVAECMAAGLFFYGMVWGPGTTVSFVEPEN
jgi:hypothetical protein